MPAGHRTHLKETPVPIEQITIDFPVTSEDLEFGYLQGDAQDAEGAEVAEGDQVDPEVAQGVVAEDAELAQGHQVAADAPPA